ncbi:MAG: hypothetical protein ACJAZM_003233, partial [Cyclobacteriaceae bacterium]
MPSQEKVHQAHFYANSFTSSPLVHLSESVPEGGYIHPHQLPKSMKTINQVEVRSLRIEDYDQLKSSMQEAYSNWPGATWGEAYIEKLVTIFPKGQFVV